VPRFFQLKFSGSSSPAQGNRTHISKPMPSDQISATSAYRIFDSHLHIIDSRFPLLQNNGFLPEPFGCNTYRERMRGYKLAGGAIVSGSFQAFDQTYLLAALQQLGAGFVGVTQLPYTVTDRELLQLDRAGVRALRFNIARGGSEEIRHLPSMAQRVFELAGWHVELYVKASDLADLAPILAALPAFSIDHLGLTKDGFATLLTLAERGARIKATGFGRVDFDVKTALRDIDSANPAALMFGTDLPSTRAPRAYTDDDFTQVIDALGSERAQAVFFGNAARFYRI
jgi:predicted TIM-barrel fold metal-dependent hydrolase